jgi:hypothetical protein
VSPGIRQRQTARFPDPGATLRGPRIQHGTSASGTFTEPFGVDVDNSPHPVDNVKTAVAAEGWVQPHYEDGAGYAQSLEEGIRARLLRQPDHIGAP